MCFYTYTYIYIHIYIYIYINQRDISEAIDFFDMTYGTKSVYI